MSTFNVDDGERIYIPEKMREHHGEEFKIAELDSGIKLILLADDPVEGLKEAMSGVEDIDNLSEEVEAAAREEMEEELQ